MSLREHLRHYYARLVRKFLRNRRTPKLYVMPSTLMVELTNRCNVNCLHCPREFTLGKAMDVGEMEFQFFKAIFDQCYVTLTSISLTGLGETLLYRDLFRVTDYVKKKREDLQISISINGTLLNDEMITRLCGSGIHTVQISIDGYDQTSFSNIRKNINFGKFTERVRKLAEEADRTIDVCANVVLMRENISELPQFVDFIKKLSIRKINFTPINLVAVDFEDSYYEIFGDTRFQRQVKQLEEKAQKEELTITFYKPVVPCTFPWDAIYITWDGYIVPCCAKPFPKVLNFGDLHQQKFEEVVNCPEFRKFREQMIKGNIPPFCEKCHNFYPEIASAF